MFKKLKAKANNIATSPTDKTGSALAGMQFKGGSNGKASSGPRSRPEWQCSLRPDPATGTANPFPARNGIFFLDAKVACADQTEVGNLLVALAEAGIRPVLVPSALKIVANVLKSRPKANVGARNDRSLVEAYLVAAMWAAKPTEEVVAKLNPALDMSWLEEKRYGLSDDVEAGVWLALVNGIDNLNPNGNKADIAQLAEHTKDAKLENQKQTSDRLTISHEIVTVCRNTLGPHMLFCSDRVLEASTVEDLGGPQLASRHIDIPDKSTSIGLRSKDAAKQLITELQNWKPMSPPVSPQAPVEPVRPVSPTSPEVATVEPVRAVSPMSG